MPVGHFRLVVPALAGLLLAACATPETAALLDDPQGLPRRAEVPDVPFFPQEENACGPAALATVLNWSGLASDPAVLARQVYTPGREGSLQNDLLAGARRAGRLAVEIPSLRAALGEIAAGHPVLVLQNLALDLYPQWHYAVAVAYDLERREITLRSGRERRHSTALATFERTFQRGGDWALVVLPPDRLPATAGAEAVLRAAVGLEQAGRFEEAALAYDAILSRWPEDYAAAMGLGNVRYGLGDLGSAERAFRRAIEQEPERAEAWNNLAYVLAAAGRRKEAVTAAERAVALSPGREAPYRETLREITEG